MKRHTAHDRLLALKLQGATHLARVLETHPDEAVRLKAAMALARLAIPALPKSAADDQAEAATIESPGPTAPARTSTPPTATPPASSIPAMPGRSIFGDHPGIHPAPRQPTSLLAAAAVQRNALSSA